MGYSWSGMGELYEKARNEEINAWNELQEKTEEELVKWIYRHLNVQCVPCFDIDDIAHDSFIEAALRFEMIETWPQAWKYCRLTALRKMLRYLKKSSIPIRYDMKKAFDPFYDDFISQIDFSDDFESLLKKLSKKDLEFLRELFSAILEGDSVLSKIAARLGIDESTLDRRLRKLRQMCRVYLQNGNSSYPFW